MSVGGTVASVIGGGIVGLVMGLTLLLENSTCRLNPVGILVETVTWGCLGGGFGSLASSSFCFGPLAQR